MDAIERIVNITFMTNGNEYIQGFNVANLAGTSLEMKTEIELNTNFGVKHVLALTAIMAKKPLKPMGQIDSHRDIYVLMQLLKELSLGVEVYMPSFVGWTKDPNWIKLMYPEYLYLISLIAPELVDFRQFFRLHENPFATLRDALVIKEVRSNTLLHMELLSFFETFEIKSIFDELNEATKRRSNELWELKKQIYSLFTINPYNNGMQDFQQYLQYTPNNLDVWKCKAISCREPLTIGAPVITDEKTFWERYDLFTCGMLEKLKLTNCFVAGGSINLLLEKEFKDFKASDVDIFIPADKENKGENFAAILRAFDGPNTYYAIRGSVVNVYIAGLNRTFQLISMKETNMYDLLRRFDYTHIQLGVNYDANGKREVVGTIGAFKALRERCSRFGYRQRIQAKRIVKTLYRGYDIVKDNWVIENCVDMSPYINDKENPLIAKLLRELHGYFHPRTDDEPEYILRMIEQTGNASLVTHDVTYVLNNVIIGGNFRIDYEAMSYRNFNSNEVVNVGIPRRDQIIQVKSKSGQIRLMSGDFRIITVLSDAAGVNLNLEIKDPDFAKFMLSIENNVFRRFCQEDLTRRVVADTNGMKSIKIFIPKHTINNQEKLNFTCLRTQRGETLNVEEDLRADDVIRIIFYMTFTVKRNEKGVDVVAAKLIKQVTYENLEVKTDEVAESSDDEELVVPQLDIKYGNEHIVSYD